MTACPGDERLGLYADGELGGRERLALMAHLAECAPCAERHAAIAALGGILAAPGEDRLSADGLARALSVPDLAPAPARWRQPALLAAAATVLVAAWLGVRAASTPAPAPSLPPPPTLRKAPGRESPIVLYRLARGKDAEAARDALRRLADDPRVESLPALLAAAEIPDREAEAVVALVALDDERVLRALGPILLAGRHDGVILPALERIGGPEAARLLAARAEAELAPVARWQVLETLARTGGREAVRRLLLLASDPLLREETLHAVSANADRLAADLVACAGGRSVEESRAAFGILELTAPPAAVPGLARLLDDRRRRAAAARCLARIDSAESAAALLAAARHPQVREAFAVAGPVTEERLIERLGGRSTLVRAETVDLLGRCGGPRAAAALLPLADDPALAPRVLAALARIGPEGGIAALDRLAERPRLARPALAALGDTGAEEAVAPIVRHGLADPRLRGLALRALSRIPSELAARGAELLDPDRGPREPLARGEAPRTRSTSIY